MHGTDLLIGCRKEVISLLQSISSWNVMVKRITHFFFLLSHTSKLEFPFLNLILQLQIHSSCDNDKCILKMKFKLLGKLKKNSWSSLLVQISSTFHVGHNILLKNVTIRLKKRYSSHHRWYRRNSRTCPNKRFIHITIPCTRHPSQYCTTSEQQEGKMPGFWS